MSLATRINSAATGLLHRLDPETAHDLAMRGLRLGLVPSEKIAPDPGLATRFLGFDLANPIGLAAGFDKNALAPDALLGLGFGFVEVGTVTPRPQPGNLRPRLFRLTEDRAIINRFGFNNDGHDAVYSRLAARSGKPGLVGINIGANKDSTDRVADYVLGIQRFADLAAYFTVNVSSPNTPGLRDLQARDALAELLAGVMTARNTAAVSNGRRIPVLLKIAPDIGDADLDDVAEVALAAGIDGLIISNTTLSRTGLVSAKRTESGGMSGLPLFQRSTVILARMRQRVGPELPIIGVGGISTAEDVIAKIEAGADVVQIYSDFIYQGPSMVANLCKGLRTALAARGINRIDDLKSTAVADWASAALPD